MSIETAIVDVIDAREMSTRDLLYKFVQIKAGETLTFVTRMGDGNNYVQRMRVELSRVRRRLEEANKTPKSFKMRVMDVQRNPDIEVPGDLVRLKMDVGIEGEVLTELDGLFSAMSAGEKIDG